MIKYEQPTGFVHVAPSNDESSVLELWLAVLRRKEIFLAAVTASALIGLVVVLGLSPQERISTIIEIGTRVADNRIAPIETPQAALVKINEGYIPLAQNEYLRKYPDRNIISVKASVPKNGDVVLLESHAPPADEAFQIEQHLRVVKLLQQDHDRTLSLVRNDLQQRLKQGENALAALSDSRALLLASIRRIDQKSAIIGAEVKETERLLRAAEKNWDNAVREASNASVAVAQLLMINNLQQQQTKLAELKQNLLVKTPDERDRLRKSVEDNQRAQEEQKTLVENIRMQLANLQETRPLGGGPLRSPLLVQPKRSLIFLAILLVGTMVGIIAAIVADSIDRARYTAKARSALVS